MLKLLIKTSRPHGKFWVAGIRSAWAATAPPPPLIVFFLVSKGY